MWRRAVLHAECLKGWLPATNQSIMLLLGSGQMISRRPKLVIFTGNSVDPKGKMAIEIVSFPIKNGDFP